MRSIVLRRSLAAQRRAGLVVLALLAALVAPVAGIDGPASAASGYGSVGVTAPTTVDVGQQFTISGGYAGPDIGPFIEVTIPAAFHIDLALASAGHGLQGCSVRGQQVSCVVNNSFGLVSFGVQVTALHLANDQHVVAVASSEIGSTAGQADIDVIDPTITADAHPSINAPAQGVVGEQLTLVGPIINAGSTTLTVLRATFSIDAKLHVDSATKTSAGTPCTITLHPGSTTTVTCSLGTIPGYHDIPVTVLATPTAPGPTHSTVTVTTTHAEDDPDPHPDVQALDLPVVTPTVDLGTVLTGPNPVAIDGDLTRVDAVVTNKGPALARDTRITVTVPATFEDLGPFVTETLPNHQPCTTSGQTVTCPVGDLPAGESVAVSELVRPSGTTGGTWHASATSAVPETAPDPTPDTASLPVTVGAAISDIDILEPVEPMRVVAHTMTSVLLRFVNRGPADGQGLVAHLTLPSDWTIQLILVSGAGDCTVTGPSLSCTLTGVRNGDDRTITARVTTGATRTGTVTTAIDSSIPDPDGPAHTSVPVSVVPTAADVSVFVPFDTYHPVAGLYQNAGIRYQNRGPSDATNVAITVTVPTGVTMQPNPNLPAPDCTINGPVATCRVGTVAADDSGAFPLNLRWPATSNTPRPLSATITTSTPTVLPDTLPNTSTATFTVATGPGSFFGTVRAEHGTPTSGAIVRAYRTTDRLAATGKATSDTNGHYQVEGLPPGSYQLQFTFPDGTQTWEDGTNRSHAAIHQLTGLSEHIQVDAIHPPPG